MDVLGSRFYARFATRSRGAAASWRFAAVFSWHFAAFFVTFNNP